MAPLTPLEALFEQYRGEEKPVPLPTRLAALYGRLSFPIRSVGPHIIGNFVTTIDGVTSLGQSSTAGSDISGSNSHDHMVMGILRAVADVVIVGAGTVRSFPKHIWTAEHIYRPLANEYSQLRLRMGKGDQPLNVIVSGSGNIDPSLPVLHCSEVSTAIVTSQNGEDHLRRRGVPNSVTVLEVDGQAPFNVNNVINAVTALRDGLILVEGGPQMIGYFFAEKLLDELFLTIAPQLAGRDPSQDRSGLIAGQILAPDRPLWGQLASAKRGGDHLFLRYTFPVTHLP